MKSIRCRWRRGEKISFFDKVISLEEKLLRYASFLFSVIALYLINTEAESWVLIFTGNRQGGLVRKVSFYRPTKASKFVKEFNTSIVKQRYYEKLILKVKQNNH